MEQHLVGNVTGDPLGPFSQLAPSTLLDKLAFIAISLALSTFALRGYLWDQPDPYQHLWYERPQAADGDGSSTKATTRNIAEKAEELVCFHTKDCD